MSEISDLMAKERISYTEAAARLKAAAGSSLGPVPGSRLRVGMAALSKRIYVGRILKDGVTWRDGKQDVTSDVLKSFVDFVTPGFEIDVTVDGKPKYRIRVTEIVDGANK